MAKTRLVSAFVAAGVIAVGVPAGIAWAGGPGGAVEDTNISQAVGTGTFIGELDGFTATGATALSGLDALPLSVNVWRCFMMLIGGLGIIVLAVAILPMLGVGGALYSTGALGAAPSFPLFFASFIWLFFWTGVGNASTFQMIPALVRADMLRLMPNASPEERLKASELESAAIVGFSSAIGAYGGFFIPLAFASSMAATGGPADALYVFLGFYLTCTAVNWVFYARKNSILNPTSNKAA